MTLLGPMYWLVLMRKHAATPSGSRMHTDTSASSTNGEDLESCASSHSGRATPRLSACGPSGWPYFS